MVSGMIMAEGGISKQLFEFFGYFIGNKTAGFPCAVVVTCMFYAAISGSAPATVSAVGSMTIPFLVNMGYDVVFSAAIVTVAGALGVIIPPSISYIVYSAAANASPSALFIAGIIPGCLIGFFLMAYCWYYCKKNGEDKEKLQENYNKIREKGFLKLFKESFFALMTPVTSLDVSTPVPALRLRQLLSPLSTVSWYVWFTRASRFVRSRRFSWQVPRPMLTFCS